MAIDTVVQRSAGLDIAKASLVACVRIPTADGGWQVIKRKFTTMTADLLALRDWLAEHNIARVGMESTSDYWRPVFYVLEQRFDCWLLNARHMRGPRPQDRHDRRRVDLRPGRPRPGQTQLCATATASAAA